MDHYNPSYNILKVAGSSFGFTHKIETIVKLKELFRKENHPNYGNKYTSDTKKKKEIIKCQLWNSGQLVWNILCISLLQRIVQHFNAACAHYLRSLSRNYIYLFGSLVFFPRRHRRRYLPTFSLAVWKRTRECMHRMIRILLP